MMDEKEEKEKEEEEKEKEEEEEESWMEVLREVRTRVKYTI